MGLVSFGLPLVLLSLLAVTPGEADLRRIPVSSNAACTQALLPEGLGFQERMLRNISPQGAARGAVIASPSTSDPNYFYHWIRDGALTMDVVVRLWEHENEPGRRTVLFQYIWDYLVFSRQNQLTVTLTGLGEPKYEADGRAFDGEWGRPQNDGPALRAVTAARVALASMAQGRRDLADQLYRAEMPARTLIKNDLEYVAHHWRDASVDLWEEVTGDHYYTRLAQLRALRIGSVLARELGDVPAARFYTEQAEAIAASLDGFWDPAARRLKATVNRVRGVDYKHSELDAAVVLAALHAGADGERGGVDDDRLLATIPVLELAFTQAYPINGVIPHLPPAIGRYPEDRYYGGNPWILTTAAMAEHAFRLVVALRHKDIELNETNGVFWHAVAPGLPMRSRIIAGSAEHTQVLAGLQQRGEGYLARVSRHMPEDGRLDEQWDRTTGFQASARDLTWSYASLVTALLWRDAALTK